MLPLVRVVAAVSADVVTSTKLFAMRYSITSFASARFASARLHPDQALQHGGHTAASTVVALHEASSLSLHVLHRVDVFSVDGSHTVDAYSTIGLTNVWQHNVLRASGYL